MLPHQTFSFFPS